MVTVVVIITRKFTQTCTNCDLSARRTIKGCCEGCAQ